MESFPDMYLHAQNQCHCQCSGCGNDSMSTGYEVDVDNHEHSSAGSLGFALGKVQILLSSHRGSLHSGI